LTKVLGLHTTKGFLHQKKKLKTTEKPSLCHLSIWLRSRRGGTVDVAEAIEGEIIDARAGVNFFAFSKKAFNSARVRP
jgi:hypothetical protein